MDWLISANSKIYDHSSSFEHHKFIDWRQSNYNFQVGDIIYIYCTAPLKKIRYKSKASNVNIPFEGIRDDKEYWVDFAEYEKAKAGKYMRLDLIEQIDTEKLTLSNLLKHGLLAAPQGPKKLDDPLLSYIQKNFTDSNLSFIFPEMIDEDSVVFEGIKKTILVNKYERSSIARAKCIEFHGFFCQICGIDFGKVYGEIGHGFIHVHHVTPISRIGESYKVDYKKDLIPVCPNCHAMLHQKKENGEDVTIDFLMEILKSNAG